MIALKPHTAAAPTKLLAFAAAVQAANALRQEWAQMLALNASLRLRHPTGHSQSCQWLDQSDRNIRTLLDTLNRPKPAGECFTMRLASVGNVDMGQFHGEGEGSPSLTIECESLVELVKIHQAYLAVYDLGGGNLARGCGDVYRGEVMVAHVSYNGRIWTDNNHGKELDPATGKERAK